jgi:NADP-dependent 3-hydroxy acid dehydrogenase YdfG
MSSPFFQIFRVVFFLSVYHWGALENAACGKFALRALAQSLAREYQPQGIHVAHIIVDGVISSARYSTIKEEDAMMKPDEIAEIYWHVHSQHKSAWTHELDVRPFPEKF